MRRISDVLWTMFSRIESYNSLCTSTKVQSAKGVTYRIHTARSFPRDCFSLHFMKALFGMLVARWQLRKFGDVTASFRMTYQATVSIQLGCACGPHTFRAINMCLSVTTKNYALLDELTTFEEKIRPFAPIWDLTKSSKPSHAK